MEKRDYQPSLLWVKVQAWYDAQQDPMSQHRPLGPHDLTLYIYRTDQSGAYMMHGPKLYWTDEPMSGQYFRNTDQDDLFENADLLGEVVLWDRRTKKTVLIGHTFEAAVKKIGGERG